MLTAPEFTSQEPAVVPIAGPLQAIREEWEAIYEESPVRSPFLSFDYLCLWYHCFADRDTIRVIRIESRGQTVGFLPLVLKRQAGRRVLRSLTNSHCFHCPPLIRPGREKEFSEGIYSALAGERSSWDVVELSCFLSFRPDFDMVSPERLSESGFENGRQEQPDFTIDLRGTFDEYYRQVLTSKLRTNLKSRLKRFQEAGGGSIQHLQKDEAVARFDDFLQLEDSGWKGRAGSSIRSMPENYHRYYRNLIRLLAGTDDLHLFLLNLNEQPIAGAFGYTDGEMFHWFKIGYREEYGEMAPMNLLLLDNIKYFMENRRDIKWFHLFPDDGGYKHRWVKENTTTVDVTLFSDSFRGKLSYSTHLARTTLKRIPWFHRAVQHILTEKLRALFWIS